MEDKLNRSSLFKRSLREVTNNSIKSSKNSQNKSIGVYLNSKTLITKKSPSTTPRGLSTRKVSPRDETYPVNYPV